MVRSRATDLHWIPAEERKREGREQTRTSGGREFSPLYPCARKLSSQNAFKDLYLLTRKDVHNTLQSEKRRFRKVYQLRFNFCKAPCIYLYMYAEKILWSKTHSNANSGGTPLGNHNMAGFS